MHLSRYDSAQELLKLGSDMLDMLKDHIQKYTQQQQNALNTYQWIKVWFTSVQKLYVNHKGASENMPAMLNKLESIGKVWEMNDGAKFWKESYHWYP